MLPKPNESCTTAILLLSLYSNVFQRVLQGCQPACTARPRHFSAQAWGRLATPSSADGTVRSPSPRPLRFHDSFRVFQISGCLNGIFQSFSNDMSICDLGAEVQGWEERMAVSRGPRKLQLRIPHIPGLQYLHDVLKQDPWPKALHAKVMQKS